MIPAPGLWPHLHRFFPSIKDAPVIVPFPNYAKHCQAPGPWYRLVSLSVKHSSKKITHHPSSFNTTSESHHLTFHLKAYFLAPYSDLLLTLVLFNALIVSHIYTPTVTYISVFVSPPVTCELQLKQSLSVLFTEMLPGPTTVSGT